MQQSIESRDAEHRATVLSIESLACRLGFAVTALSVGALLDRDSLALAIAAILVLGLAPIVLSGFLSGTRSALSANERDARGRS